MINYRMSSRGIPILTILLNIIRRSNTEILLVIKSTEDMQIDIIITDYVLAPNTDYARMMMANGVQENHGIGSMCLLSK